MRPGSNGRHPVAISGTKSRTDTLTTFHFFILGEEERDGLTLGIFTEISGLDVQIKTDDFFEGGVNDHQHHLPSRTVVSDVTLRNGVVIDNKLLDWFNDVLQGVPSGKFPRKNVSVVMVDQRNVARLRLDFIEALPIKWTGPTLRSGDNSPALQTLVLTHRGVKIITNPVRR